MVSKQIYCLTEYLSQSFCYSKSFHVVVIGETSSIYSRYMSPSVHVACGQGSVLLLWDCNTLRSSDFMDNVMVSYDGLIMALLPAVGCILS